ncbi:hypothetical protein [Candidatus Palauibacter sp.]|uniref:hypothetical protein n=1 Tax=Candidatus Palauibacter sp. TaxID=3101350 RepID=UPI003AF2909B
MRSVGIGPRSCATVAAVQQAIRLDTLNNDLDARPAEFSVHRAVRANAHVTARPAQISGVLVDQMLKLKEEAVRSGGRIDVRADVGRWRGDLTP